MKNLTSLSMALLVCLFVISCDQRSSGDENETAENNQTARDTAQSQFVNGISSDHLEQVWETKDTFMVTPESVIYDKKRDRLYVSNINGNPTEKDGNGYITAIDTDGNLISGYLFSGYLDAPKGMAIHNNKLYVSDITKLVEIDLETEASTNTWQIDTAQFLNDVAAGPDGNIYFSDSRTNTIYVLRNGNVEVFLNDDKLNGPNGIFIDGNTMMLTNMNGGGELLKINMDDKSISQMTKEIGAGDGIAPAGNGRFLASSWSGQVFLIDSMGTKETILDTRENNINSADIAYIEDSNMLIVPTFNNNRVVAYRLKN